jgi:hypothetical protein
MISLIECVYKVPEKTWKREFFMRGMPAYQHCDVLGVWVDHYDHAKAFYARKPNGDEFFAVPAYGTFMEKDEWELQTNLQYGVQFTLDHARRQLLDHQDYIERNIRRYNVSFLKPIPEKIAPLEAELKEVIERKQKIMGLIDAYRGSAVSTLQKTV